MSRNRAVWRWWVGLLLVAGGGCSGGPSGPDISPAASGKAALAQYDANHDDKIDAAEAKNSPPLVVAFARIDTDKDGSLSAAEITARVDSWLNSGTTITNGSTHVSMDGQHLAGATVTFEPEKFLGPAFQACSGTTDIYGQTGLAGHDTKFPGVYLGLYRIRVSKVVDGKETLPARYNTESELGYEVATDLPNIQSMIEVRLKSQ